MAQQDQRHPKSAYEGKYPYVQVWQSEGGHEIHIDNTPGKERLRDSHKSGTYREIDKDGRLVEAVVSHHIHYVKGGFTQTVDKNHDVKVAGSTRSNIAGDTHSEVKGSSTSAVSKDHKSIVGGDSVSAVGGDSVHGVKGKMSLKVGGGMELKGDGDKTMKVDGKVDIQVGGALSLTSKKSITLTVGQSTITMTDGQVEIKSGTIKLTGSGEVDINGHPVKVNGGGNTIPPFTVT